MRQQQRLTWLLVRRTRRFCQAQQRDQQTSWCQISSGGLHAALDVTCVNSLQALTVNRAATEPGYALELRHRQKWGKYGEACLAEGVRFCPVVVELHGGYHKEGEEILRRISGALSKVTGGDEGEVTRHFFGRLAVLLQKGNSALLLNRVPTTVEASVDGTLL